MKLLLSEMVELKKKKKKKITCNPWYDKIIHFCLNLIWYIHL